MQQVGILFFLFEFFSDQLLAFMVLSVVWLCEVYSVVSVRTSMSIRFFPQVTGLPTIFESPKAVFVGYGHGTRTASVKLVLEGVEIPLPPHRYVGVASSRLRCTVANDIFTPFTLNDV